MTPKITAPLLALLGAASINCASPQPAEHPQQPDCSSIDLSKKIGFSAEIESKKGNICYKIVSAAGESYEFAGFCKPEEGTFQFYRHFAGLNKGGMEADYTSNYSGMTAYISFGRTPSGFFTFPSGIRMPEEEMEQIFKTGAEALDSIKKNPQVCKKLQKYQDNASKH